MKIEFGNSTITFRKPKASDGSALWQLTREIGVLDLNSPYAYLLIGEHFSETCVVAEKDGEIVGFVSAYTPSQAPYSIFVWQVGVAVNMRGQGLALEMLLAILKREICQNIQTLNTTITASNIASRALFSSLANRVNGSLQEQQDYFLCEWFPEGKHEAESLFTITPIQLATTK